MAFKFNLISSHSTPFWYHRRNRVEPQSWTTARERIISLCCPLWGWGTHSQFCGWLWRRYNLHMGIILYVGYRVPASPLASLRKKLRLILQMQPNQTKPNQTCGSCFTAAVWSHWRDSGLSPTRKAKQHQYRLLGPDALTPMARAQHPWEAKRPRWVQGTARPAKLGAQGWSVFTFPCSAVQTWASQQLSLYLHAHRRGP